jgi:hypothetical protein
VDCAIRFAELEAVSSIKKINFCSISQCLFCLEGKNNWLGMEFERCKGWLILLQKCIYLC